MLSNARFVMRSTMSGLIHKSMQDQVASLWKNIYLPACLQMQDQETGTQSELCLSACSIHTIFVNS